MISAPQLVDVELGGDAACRDLETAIGYRIARLSLEPPTYGVRLNPDRHETLTFATDDQIIVLSEGIGVSTAAERRGR